MKTKQLLVSLTVGLVLALALVWAVGSGSAPAGAAPLVSNAVESPGAARSSTVHCTTTLTGVHIAGPTTGTIGAPYTFTATVAPSTATPPITYTWQATEQSDVVAPAQGLSHTVSYTWTATSAKTITITAANCGDAVSRTHTITLEPVRLYLPLVMRNWPPSSWHSQCADCPRSFDAITQRSIVLDSGDHPHVAYGGDSL
ncbi:MAG: hypothetical protein U9R15_17695, partial [Chloroflexota bacterium]|nr:hypothetical protein [Chloroflexota bacterium]